MMYHTCRVKESINKRKIKRAKARWGGLALSTLTPTNPISMVPPPQKQPSNKPQTSIKAPKTRPNTRLPSLELQQNPEIMAIQRAGATQTLPWLTENESEKEWRSSEPVKHSRGEVPGARCQRSRPQNKFEGSRVAPKERAFLDTLWDLKLGR